MTNTKDKLKVSISNLSNLILEIIAIFILLGGIIPLFISETKMSFFCNILDPVIFIPAIITAIRTLGKNIKILALMVYSLVSIIIICFFYEHLKEHEVSLKVLIYFWYISLFYILQRRIKKDKNLTNYMYTSFILLILINSFMCFYYIPYATKHLEANIEQQQMILDRIKILHSNIHHILDCRQKLNSTHSFSLNAPKTDLTFDMMFHALSLTNKFGKFIDNNRVYLDYNASKNIDIYRDKPYKELMQKFDKTAYNKYLEFEKNIQKLQKDKNNTSISEFEKYSGVYFSNCQESKVVYSSLSSYIVNANYEYNKFFNHPIWAKQYEAINKRDIIHLNSFSFHDMLSLFDFIEKSYSPLKIFYKDIEIYDNHYIFEWCTPINVFAKDLIENKSSFVEQQKKLLNEYKIKTENWKREKDKYIQSLRNMSYEEIKTKYHLQYFKKDMINNIAEIEACKNIAL